MFLELDGVLVNLAHVAQVLPYTPGEKKRLTIILSNGQAVHVPDGERAVEAVHAFKLHCGQIPRSDTPVPKLNGIPIQYVDNFPLTAREQEAMSSVVRAFHATPQRVVDEIVAPKPPKKGKK